MRYYILSIMFVLSITKALAQDSVCQKLINLIKNNYINNKYSSRCFSKSSSNGIDMEMIMELDTFSNYSIVTLMDMKGMKYKTEQIVYNKKSYVKMNGGNWQTANLDSNELINTYIPSLNMQNQLFSNCKQLEDDKVGDKNCWVFETEIDKTTTIKDKKFEFKSRNKMWITPIKGLVLKMVTESVQNNITMKLESIIEYDNTIKIVEPVK